MNKNKPYEWDDVDKLNIPYGNIDMHSALCYDLLHIKHGQLATLDIPEKAARIIEMAQAPLLKIINELQEEIEALEVEFPNGRSEDV
jgi:hypothetical protein